jgi:hypothetical protein
MQRRNIPAEKVFREWKKDPAFRAAYHSLEREFASAIALINARDQVKSR